MNRLVRNCHDIPIACKQQPRGPVRGQGTLPVRETMRGVKFPRPLYACRAQYFIHWAVDLLS
jgi:hypothetical protein